MKTVIEILEKLYDDEGFNGSVIEAIQKTCIRYAEQAIDELVSECVIYQVDDEYIIDKQSILSVKNKLK